MCCDLNVKDVLDLLTLTDYNILHRFIVIHIRPQFCSSNEHDASTLMLHHFIFNSSDVFSNSVFRIKYIHYGSWHFNMRNIMFIDSVLMKRRQHIWCLSCLNNVRLTVKPLFIRIPWMWFMRLWLKVLIKSLEYHFLKY